MSVRVPIDALRRTVEEYGLRAYLITVGDGARAHVVSVIVGFGDATLVVPGGRSTRANVLAHPTVTLVWAPPSGGQYSLIVDGHAVLDDTSANVTVVPSTAVLHRLAGADGDGPACIPLPAPT